MYEFARIKCPKEAEARSGSPPATAENLCEETAAHWAWGGEHFGFLVFVFQDSVSLYNSPDCSGTSSIDQAGLKLTEICLLLPPEC